MFPFKAVVFRSYVSLPEGIPIRRVKYASHILYISSCPHLVGGIPTPLKRMKVSLDHYSQHMAKSPKPLTSHYFLHESCNLRGYHVLGRSWKREKP